jgi:hypothetical protein
MSVATQLAQFTILDRRRITAARLAELTPTNRAQDEADKREAFERLTTADRGHIYTTLLVEALRVNEANTAEAIKASGGRRSADGTGGAGYAAFLSALERAILVEAAAPLIPTATQRRLSRAWRAAQD